MKRTAGWIALVVLGCTLATAQKVQVKQDKAADFQKYRTYCWETQLADVPAGALAMGGESFDALMREAADRILQAKGYQRVDEQAKPDLTLTYHVSLQAKTAGESIFPNSPNASTKFEQVWYVSKTEGSMVLDMEDPASGKTVWTGTVTSAVTPGKAGREQRISKAVEKLLAGFPVRK